MPRNILTKDEIKHWVLKYKKELTEDEIYFTSDPKKIANKYLDKILNKIDEYAR